jgi:hypothetical protein
MLRSMLLVAVAGVMKMCMLLLYVMPVVVVAMM